MTDLVVLAAGRARRYGGIKPLAPVGQHGEAVIDLLAGDALRAGFSRLVLVVNPDTGGQIRSHVASSWPHDVDVAFSVQERPIGTVHAVLVARDEVDPTSAFGVANADDLYGSDALGVLGAHLASAGTNALVGFRLDRALVGDLPVTRGVCTIEHGELRGIVERRNVTRRGDQFVADDGLQPANLAPDTLVSMNLWGFEPRMWGALADAMHVAHDASEEREALLPELVGELVAGDGELAGFRALSTSSRCLGVTHADDLELVRGELLREIERGERPAEVFPS
jgi:hypothetical protein